VPFGAYTLTMIAPPVVTRWVALLTEAPNLATGVYVESTDTAYARAGVNAWTNVLVGTTTRRQNTAPIAFSAFDGDGGGLPITHWALFDSEVAGTLLASGVIKNLAGDAEPLYANESDSVTFNAGALAVTTG
jgi:hypothetical protein